MSLKYLYLIENVDNDLIFLLMIMKIMFMLMNSWIMDHVCSFLMVMVYCFI